MRAFAMQIKIKYATLYCKLSEGEKEREQENFTVIKRNKTRSKHRPLNNHYSSQIWLIKKRTHTTHSPINAMYIKNDGRQLEGMAREEGVVNDMCRQQFLHKKCPTGAVASSAC